MLQGAAATFQPLGGRLRGRRGAAGVLASVAGVLDKTSVALYRRPTARLVTAMYVVLLHVALVMCFSMCMGRCDASSAAAAAARSMLSAVPLPDRAGAGLEGDDAALDG